LIVLSEKAVVNEIDRSGLIGRNWPLAHNPQMAQPFAPAPSPQGQSFLAIQPFNPFMVGAPALPAQHLIEHRIAPSAPLFGQLSQPLPTAPRDTHQPAGPSLR
jgi:hypothetical protein